MEDRPKGDDAPSIEGNGQGMRDVLACSGCGETNWAVIYDLTLGVGVTSKGIECVVVEDENLGPIQRVICRECDFEFYGDEARAQSAAQIAERDDWPAWGFGW